LRLCRAVKNDNTPCNAAVGPGREFCFHHDPDRQKEAAEARRKGCEAARRKKLAPSTSVKKEPMKPFRLNSLADVKRLLARIINEFRQGIITVDQAKCIAYVANILTQTIKDTEIESRLKELEGRITERGLGNVKY
jgi:hypothetical protein